MEKLDKLPRLFYVRNLDTMEEFKIFTRTKDEAASCCPIEPDAKLEIGEVQVTTEDGCTNAIFQLRSLPITEAHSSVPSMLTHLKLVRQCISSS